ncbi:MAG: glutamate synthase large subunit, partial [Gammaproteobacteria bacterium]|nr:glutamate synthase large subunit [Gammaproteobacteria bacterium]
MTTPGALPPPQGLYDPAREHDACGVAFVVDIGGGKRRKIIDDGLEILKNLSHRGAVGADPLAGDGAGLLLQLPERFFAEAAAFDLPGAGQYAVGMLFMPPAAVAESKAVVERYARAEGAGVLGWREVPVDNSGLGPSVLPTEPAIWQVFISRGDHTNARAPASADDSAASDAFERKLFVIRKQIENHIRESGLPGAADFHVASLSSRVVNYKGMLLAGQLGEYYPDLADPRMESALALVHQRFSTNTFPAWKMAHPYRMIAHNGEINTLRGNINWLAARRRAMSSELFGDDLDKVWPLIADGQSDSASFDNALELLTLGGYSLAHAMMLLIPEAWSGNPLMDEKRRAFYEYHAALMEPWDGPAAVAFTDGRQIGATLDRNGLRPARYLVTRDGVVVMASEMGVLDIPESDIVTKWRLQPGKMLLIDLAQGRIIDDEEIKNDLASMHDYRRWLDHSQIELSALNASGAPDLPRAAAPDSGALLKTQQAFGYTQEDLKFLLLPMMRDGAEAIGSMGTDVPPSVLSARNKPLASYFKQNFAQVTNPPIDPIREQLVMELRMLIGPRPNLLGLGGGQGQRGMRVAAAQPILTAAELQGIQRIEDATAGALSSRTLDICFPAADATADAAGMESAVDALCEAAEREVEDGVNILILSDRRMDAARIAIPALLATAAVHHHLIRQGLRTRTGLVVETGACMEVHHAATLIGYGAEAIHPYTAFDTIAELLPRFAPETGLEEAQARYIAALGAGLKKVMSKMGISTCQSYCGAQIFDAVGLSAAFVAKYFTGTATAVEGVGLEQIAFDACQWHRHAFAEGRPARLDAGGDYAYRVGGEAHAWNPDTIASLQQAARGNDAGQYEAFAAAIDAQDKQLFNLRGLFEFNWSDAPLPLDEVEPASQLVKRFSTGAMSFGSISYEAHANLARAMNRLGGKSNTGEGGEEASRYNPLPDGTANPERSAIKQVASGRFGVTTDYLVNADDLQIKMAQGAKPGEGGQLPGHKVNAQIARVRHSTPGVGLISPPPHHDIYSIEDLAQLIHDLKNVNPRARIS